MYLIVFCSLSDIVTKLFINYACDISENNDLSLLLVSWRNVARESDVVPWTIYNGSFTISFKIDGQKVGSDLSYKSPHVPAELCPSLSKRNKVIAPSGNSKWVRLISYVPHLYFMQVCDFFFIFCYWSKNDFWIRYLVKTLVDKTDTKALTK